MDPPISPHGIPLPPPVGIPPSPSSSGIPLPPSPSGVPLPPTVPSGIPMPPPIPSFLSSASVPMPPEIPRPPSILTATPPAVPRTPSAPLGSDATGTDSSRRTQGAEVVTQMSSVDTVATAMPVQRTTNASRAAGASLPPQRYTTASQPATAPPSTFSSPVPPQRRPTASQPATAPSSTFSSPVPQQRSTNTSQNFSAAPGPFSPGEQPRSTTASQRATAAVDPFYAGQPPMPTAPGQESPVPANPISAGQPPRSTTASQRATSAANPYSSGLSQQTSSTDPQATRSTSTEMPIWSPGLPKKSARASQFHQEPAPTDPFASSISQQRSTTASQHAAAPTNPFSSPVPPQAPPPQSQDSVGGQMNPFSQQVDPSAQFRATSQEFLPQGNASRDPFGASSPHDAQFSVSNDSFWRPSDPSGDSFGALLAQEPPSSLPHGSYPPPQVSPSHGGWPSQSPSQGELRGSSNPFDSAQPHRSSQDIQFSVPSISVPTEDEPPQDPLGPSSPTDPRFGAPHPFSPQGEHSQNPFGSMTSDDPQFGATNSWGPPQSAPAQDPFGAQPPSQSPHFATQSIGSGPMSSSRSVLFADPGVVSGSGGAGDRMSGAQLGETTGAGGTARQGSYRRSAATAPQACSGPVDGPRQGVVVVAGFGGKMLVCNQAQVEAFTLRDVLERSSKENAERVNELQDFPGPLGAGDTKTTEKLVAFFEKRSENPMLPRSDVLMNRLLIELLRANGQRDHAFSQFTEFLGMARDGCQPLAALGHMALDVAQGRVDQALEQGATSNMMWPHVLLLSEFVSRNAYLYSLARFTAFMDSDPQPPACNGPPNDPYVMGLKQLYGLRAQEVPVEKLVEEAVHCWQPAVAIITTVLRRSEDSNFAQLVEQYLVALGNKLAAPPVLDATAAHICFVLSKAHQLESVDTASGVMSVLGVEHRVPSNFPKLLSSHAFHWTETYEYTIRLVDKEYVAAGFQPFKMAHAMELAEHGMLDKADRYLEMTNAFIKTFPNNKYCDGLRTSLRELTEQLHPSETHPMSGNQKFFAVDVIDGVAGGVGTLFARGAGMLKNVGAVAGLTTKPIGPPALGDDGAPTGSVSGDGEPGGYVPAPPGAFGSHEAGGQSPPPASQTPSGFGPPPPASQAPTGFGPPPANQPPSGFGPPPPASQTPTGFGPPPVNQPSSGFAPSPPASQPPGGFGPPPVSQGSSGFGPPAGNQAPGGFGPPPSNQAPGGFGPPPPANQAPGGFGPPPPANQPPGGFGAPPVNQAPGGFGPPPPANQAPGGFGPPPPANQGPGGFGPPPARTTSGTGAFGPPGRTTSGAGAFGGPPTNQTPGGFGGPPQYNTPQPPMGGQPPYTPQPPMGGQPPFQPPMGGQPQFQPMGGQPQFQPMGGQPQFQPMGGQPQFGTPQPPMGGQPPYDSQNSQYAPMGGQPPYNPQNGQYAPMGGQPYNDQQAPNGFGQYNGDTQQVGGSSPSVEAGQAKKNLMPVDDPIVNASKALWGGVSSVWKGLTSKTEDDPDVYSKIGAPTTMYYDEVAKRWRDRGSEDRDISKYDPMTGKIIVPPPEPPPPMAMTPGMASGQAGPPRTAFAGAGNRRGVGAKQLYVNQGW